VISIPAARTLRLDRPLRTFAATASGWLLCMDERLVGTVLDPSFRNVARLTLQSRNNHLAISPDGRLVAELVWARDRRLHHDEGDVAVFAVDSGKVVQRLEGRYMTCEFAGGSELWTVRSQGRQHTVELHDISDGRVSRKVSFSHPLDIASTSLQLHAEIEGPLVALHDGNGDARLVWIRDEGDVLQPRDVGSHFSTDLAFDALGRKFLATGALNIREHGFPDGEVLGNIDNEDEDADWHAAAYLSSDQAIVHGSGGLLHVLDTTSMRIVDSACIEGHAVRHGSTDPRAPSARRPDFPSALVAMMKKVEEQLRELDLGDREEPLESDLSWFRTVNDEWMVSAHHGPSGPAPIELVMWKREAVRP
jgi:hypothetical protein